MGFADAFTYSCAEEVFEELKQAWNPKTGWDIRGVTYERLRATPVQWPAADADGPDRNPIRYLNDGVSQSVQIRDDGTRPRLTFPTASGRAQFFARPHLPAAELPDDDYPFVLNTGRLQHQWHTLTKTGKVAKLAKLNPGPFVEVHPEDAAALGIADGDHLQITSRRGRAVLPAVVTDRVRPGNCFAPFHWNDLFGEYLAVNAVTNDAVDPVSFQPEFKVCAVALTRTAAPVPATGPDRRAEAGSISAEAAPSSPAALTVLANALGISDLAPPVLAEPERQYLSGFLAALATAPVTGVPVLPPAAPIETARALWVDGMLAGMFSRVAPEQPASAAPIARRVLVLWASQTGNAEDFTQTIVARLTEAGHAAELTPMASTDPAQIPGDSDLLLVTSTFGDGDAPDNGSAFWQALSAAQAPRMEGVRYSVLAFGDSSYDDFCGHGRRLDERFAELGATRLHPRTDCEPDFHDGAEAWLGQVLTALASAPAHVPTGPPLMPPAGGQPAATATAATTAAGQPAATAAATAAATGQPAPTTAGPATFTKAAPFSTLLVGNRLLSLPGSDKEVRQFAFDTRGGELAYEAGDALGVWPANGTELVTEWLTLTGLDPQEPITIGENEPIALAEALRTRLDITRITPDLLRFIIERTGNRDLKRLARPGNKDELAKFSWGLQAIDLLGMFPVRASAAEWAAVLKRLQPRLYSISSSPLAHSDEVRLTVSVVRYTNDRGRDRKGVCSTHLADHANDGPVQVYVQRSSHFRPPADPTAPAIMVGPGTGVAPFVGFLEDRQARGHTGPNWLFYGEQHQATDFYYREELQAHVASGHLDRLDTAFSRDQRSKVYVQDRMREHGPRLWSWLQNGARFYVCGDASRMARDVDQALHEIVTLHGGMDAEAASAYVKQLAADKRYVRDVY